jgi:hypothetical protein
MKTLTTFAAVLALSMSMAAAQDLSGNANHPASPGAAVGADVTGFQAPEKLGPVNESSKMVNPHAVVKPELGGVFVDGAKYGTILISPTAPASYGIGAKYLSAPDPRYDLMHESGPAAHRDAGGIKLFSFEF